MNEPKYKKDYQEMFPKFARTSVKEIDDEINLYGHSVLVTKIDETYDIHLCDAKARLAGSVEATLGARKLNNILNTLPEDQYVHRVDGEAWFGAISLDWLNNWLYDNRRLLGLSKRKSVSCDVAERLH